MIQLDEDTSAAQATGGRILVVDDVEDNRIILARNLTRAGYDTDMVETGVAAIARVSTDPPDLIRCRGDGPHAQRLRRRLQAVCGGVPETRRHA